MDGSAHRRPGKPIKAIKLGEPIEKLLPKVREFPSAETKTGAGAGRARPVSRHQVRREQPSNFVRHRLDEGSPARARTPLGRSWPTSPAHPRRSPGSLQGHGVHVLSQKEWDAHPGLSKKTPDSAAAYDPETNTLHLNGDKLTPENLAERDNSRIRALRREVLPRRGIRPEGVGEPDAHQRMMLTQYAGRKPGRGRAAGRQAGPFGMGRHAVCPCRARGHKGHGPAPQGSPQPPPRGYTVGGKKWLGDAKLTTEALDKKIVEMLGYEKETVGAVSPRRSLFHRRVKQRPRKNRIGPQDQPEVDKALGEAFEGLSGAPAEGQEAIPPSGYLRSSRPPSRSSSRASRRPRLWRGSCRTSLAARRKSSPRPSGTHWA